MKKEEIAQWVINNRYPKSEKEKVSDAEMYHFIVAQLKQEEPREEEKPCTERTEDCNGKCGWCRD